MRQIVFRAVLIGIALVGLATLGRGVADTQGGTQIANVATATYADGLGQVYAVSSNLVVTTVSKLAGLVVTPKRIAASTGADGVAVNATVTRSFVITNASDIPDAYTITSATAGPLAIVSMVYVTASTTIPVTLNATVSPTIAPGSSLVLRMVVDTTHLALGADVPLKVTARTTVTDVANGLQTDAGCQWLIGAVGANLAGPGGLGTSILKTVNHLTFLPSQAGATVSYDIVAKNAGGTPAKDVVVRDALPAGLTPVDGSVKIGGIPAGAAASISGQSVVVQAGTVAAGAIVDISLDALVGNIATLGTTFVNSAAVSADGLPELGTTPAAVLIGHANIVFDGFTSGRPIANAQIALYDANGALVTFAAPSGSSGQPRTADAIPGNNLANPFKTLADGAYGFALQASQVAAAGSTFTLTAVAPGYLNRKIGLRLTPRQGGVLYDVASTSEDGQPIAIAGGFDLTKQAVTLNDVFGLFGNIPMFTVRAITVTKTADRQIAQPGDRVRYQIAFSNATSDPIGATKVVDLLPAGLVYASGTGKLDDRPAEPAVDGRSLTWSLPALGPGDAHAVSYDAIVYPNVAPGTQLSNTVSVEGQISGTHVTASGGSGVTVQVVAGAMTQRRPLTGRVFTDVARSGRFARGDAGVAGVRVFLEDGSSVVTDGDGRFSFPSVRPGMHVVRIDETTLPANVHPYAERRMNSTRATQQLVHGILDDGIIDDVQFALAP